MAQTSFFGASSQSQLVKRFQDMEVSDLDVSHKRFGERLGALIDLSDSFALSDAHYRISKLKVPASEGSARLAEELTREFLRIRKLIVDMIARSFSINANSRFKLPRPASDSDKKDAIKFDAYRRFYLMTQREMDAHVSRLRDHVREKLAQQSTKLAKLAALDKAVAESLRAHTHHVLIRIPLLLETRFDALRERHNWQDPSQTVESWLSEKGWLSEFYRDMQQLLLSELVLRLEPVQGMIEAFTLEVSSSNE